MAAFLPLCPGRVCLPVCVSPGIVSVPVPRGPVACVALSVCFGVCAKGFGDPSAVCLCPGSEAPWSCQGTVRVFSGFLCLPFPRPVSLCCMFLPRSSRVIFVTIAMVPRPQAPFQEPFALAEDALAPFSQVVWVGALAVESRPLLLASDSRPIS